jgi:uroporphyrinogen-III decarboxylase
MKNPKGIRDIADWYMSTLTRIDFMQELFEKQTEIALKNLETLYELFGNSIDVLFICGTDFGTQNSQFCSPEVFADLYLPYYRKMNDWIHAYTSWKTFKHSCGAIMPLIPGFIEAGFDILNPVQINAAEMDSKVLKDRYGDKITFWGGGVDTQMVLGFGTPADVEKQVIQQCNILGKNGGFVFNTVHNIQANVPVENLVAMINSLKKINGI